MKPFVRTTTLIASLVLSALSFAAEETAIDRNGVILAGHDAVAYFTENQPVPGSSAFTHDYEGATYQFASASNRDLFRANPAKYAPAYGGWCALGASFGKKFEVDGKAFEIVDGQLYVNKNKRIYRTWKKDIPGNVLKADSQWPTIKSVAASEL
jgi:YHS domain-containing protein